MSRSKPLALAACAAAALAALPVMAQAPARPGSSFAVVGQPAAGAIETARSNSTLVEFRARPISAVRLGAAIAPETAALFGARPDAPFDTARVLYGWPERPGLYCDLLRHRGLGLSAACLNDRDGDGRFDEGRRFDFNAGAGDLLALTPSGKIIGVRTAAKPAPVALPAPVAYTAAEAPADVAGRLALKWRKIELGAEPAAELWITTPGNYTGTDGLSEQVLRVPFARAPLDLELYGIKLRVLGFDDKGAMRYQVLEVRDGARVPLLFRGYTFRIMIL